MEKPYPSRPPDWGRRRSFPHPRLRPQARWYRISCWLQRPPGGPKASDRAAGEAAHPSPLAGCRRALTLHHPQGLALILPAAAHTDHPKLSTGTSPKDAHCWEQNLPPEALGAGQPRGVGLSSHWGGGSGPGQAVPPHLHAAPPGAPFLGPRVGTVHGGGLSICHHTSQPARAMLTNQLRPKP